MYRYVWQPEVSLGCFLQKLSTLFFEAESLIGTWCLTIRLAAYLGLVSSVHTIIPGFLCGFQEMNTSPYTCNTNTSVAMLSPQHQIWELLNPPPETINCGELTATSFSYVLSVLFGSFLFKLPLLGVGLGMGIGAIAEAFCVSFSLLCVFNHWDHCKSIFLAEI